MQKSSVRVVLHRGLKSNIDYERIDVFIGGSAISGQSALKINRPSS